MNFSILTHRWPCIFFQIKAFVLPVIQGRKFPFRRRRWRTGRVVYSTFHFAVQLDISITSMAIGNNHVTFALISRRGHGRAGTRYFSRGIDEHGHVSNYVETEQLVIFGNADSTVSKDTPSSKLVKLSFTQTRGSIPIFWGQIPNTRYVPQLWYDPEISTQVRKEMWNVWYSVSSTTSLSLVQIDSTSGQEAFWWSATTLWAECAHQPYK